MPLGPGIPGGFLHALGRRDDWQQLEVFGALLLDYFTVFTQPGVRLRSGFFGPAERALRDAGGNVEFIPADFRRFVTIAEQFAPRVMTTAATPPDADGFMSLSLHAGATVGGAAPRRARSGPAPHRRGEPNSSRARSGYRREYPHTLHVDEVDAIVRNDAPPFVLRRRRSRRRRSRHRRPRARFRHGWLDVADGYRRRAVDDRRGSGRGPGRRLRHSLRDVHDRPDATAPGGQGDERAQGRVPRVSRSRRSRSARPSSTRGSTGTPRCASCPSTS